jgi:ribosomal protein S18 acetylase RimI-like enzyme
VAQTSEQDAAGITLREFARDSSEYQTALRLREAVLRKPLGLAFTAEELADEPACFHLGAFQEERLIAVLLLKPLGPNELKMRQVAVAPEFQHLGIGSRLVGFAEQFASKRGYRAIRAHARETAAEFYRKAGYTISSERFLENTIPHQLATKRLAQN